MNEAIPNSKVLLLECITGQDRFSRIAVGQQVLIMANSSLQPHIAIKELNQEQGYLAFHSEDNAIRFDASNCHLPVFFKGNPARLGLLHENDLLRIGNSLWQVHSSYNPQVAPLNLRKQFNNLIGLEELQDFRLATIFSEVFKKHTREEMEEQLITGTSRNTPSLSSIKVGWGRPWLFARLLAWSVVLAFILYIGFDMFNNINLVPGLIFVGSFAVPVSTLIFFLEMNIPRNVSIFTVLQFLFVGGVASLIVALLLFSKFDFFRTYLGASAAGIVEETAKLMVVILLIGKTIRYRWILNGLLIGAAVGTGFAAFESAGYALRVMLESGMDAGVNTIMLRGLLAPFTHIVWTANATAALWLIKKDKPFSWDMLQSPIFLRIMISVTILHMLWNAPFTLMQLPLILDLKFLILGVLAWIICFRLVQAGLKQLNEQVQQEVPANMTEIISSENLRE